MSATTIEWKTKSLEELSERIDYGHTASADTAVVGPKFLRITDIQNGDVNWDTVPYCPATPDEIDKYRLCDGDIVFARTGNTTGKSFLLKQPPKDSVFASYLIRVRPSRGVDARFLAHFFDTPNYWSQIKKNAQGAGQPGVNASRLKTLEIPVPPLSDQKRIADILDKADAIRRKRQEAVAIVESELLRSAFREQLGDPRTNPKCWPIEQLGNVINFVGGSQPPKETFINEPRPGYVRLVQIRDFKTDKYPTYIPKELAKRSFVKDDVMIARYGPPVFQILRGLEGSYNVALMKAENTERTTRDFIFYLLQIPEIHDVVVANSQRTAGQSGTNLTLLKGLEMPIPPIEKQIEITAILKSIENYHATARSYCNAADELFNSLVQTAFKGDL